MTTDIQLATGSILRVEPITPYVFRLRLRPDTNFREPGLVRYGIVRTEWPDFEVATTDDGDSIAFATGRTTLTVSKTDGKMAFTDAAGRTILREAAPPQSDPATGFSAQFALGADERLFGLGDETRDRLQKRGHEAAIVLRNVTSYVPIPYLMSTGGWAIFLNSTWFHHVDAGAADPERLTYRARRGELDYYVIAGAGLPELLDRYTEITGRPHLLPQWAYGLTFVCDERGVRARDVLYEALNFRREGVPCDLIGLEPDWMEKHYDFSVNKQWSPERFHAPFWLPHRKPGGFTAALGNMGFKLSLWLCCDYDVSEYEEQLLGTTRQEDDAPLPAERYEEDIIKDPHFHPSYMDQITRPGEAWFEHLKKFVDDGAEAFKLDGSNQICFHPDRKWANGMDDQEMHNLYPMLLAKQMSLGYRDHTSRRAMIYTAGGYAGIQQYAATWAGDTGGSEKPLVSLLNHGLSGHSNVSCDMQVWNPAGIHFGFLQPWSQVLSWHQYNQPWFLKPEIYEVFKFYARLRYRLVPYLYSMGHIAARTGMPIMRAMPLVTPDDPACDDRMLQYMLGDSLLTCAFTTTIALPAGKWIDYWTGEEHVGPQELTYTPPPGRGGPLFVRAGAIIPTWPELDFIGQCEVTTVGLDVYPEGDSSFVLYEDDGISYEYLAGAVATTTIACQATAQATTVSIGPRVGSYEGMPAERSWEVTIHCAAAPASVLVDGMAAPVAYDALTRTVKVIATEDPARKQPAVVRCEW